MNDDYPRREFTVRLQYVVRLPQNETYTTTVTADDEETAIELAWTKMYEESGCDSDEVDEDDVTILKEKTVPGPGHEDDQTNEMFPK